MRWLGSFEVRGGGRGGEGSAGGPRRGVAIGALVVVALVGCRLDENGMGSGSGPLTPGTDAGTTEEPGTTASPPATDATGEGGSATGDPGTTSGASTGALDDLTTDPPPEGSSSGSGDPDSGDPPPAGQPYGPCDAGSCMGADVVCYENAGSICMPSCEGESTTCPAAPFDHQSLIECIEVPSPAEPHCMLNCAAGGTASCPAGSTCIEIVTDVFRCLWP